MDQISKSTRKVDERIGLSGHNSYANDPKEVIWQTLQYQTCRITDQIIKNPLTKPDQLLLGFEEVTNIQCTLDDFASGASMIGVTFCEMHGFGLVGP